MNKVQHSCVCVCVCAIHFLYHQDEVKAKLLSYRICNAIRQTGRQRSLHKFMMPLSRRWSLDDHWLGYFRNYTKVHYYYGKLEQHCHLTFTFFTSSGQVVRAVVGEKLEQTQFSVRYLTLESSPSEGVFLFSVWNFSRSNLHISFVPWLLISS